MTVVIYLGLTPFLLHKLGLDAYGVFALVSSFWGLVSNLDGGTGPCASRYFAVLAGSRDREATGQLLVTISMMTLFVAAPLIAFVWALAPEFVLVLHASAPMRHAAVTLVRLFMPLLTFSLLRWHLTRIVTAEHRWAYLNIVTAGSLVGYAGVSVALLELGQGLISLFWATLAREALMFIASSLGARHSLSLRRTRLFNWPLVKELGSYAARAQIAEVASSFNFEIDALVVGALFPVRDVGLYAIGVNFALQLTSLPINAMSPIAVILSRTFGRDGIAATVAEFVRLQRAWVRCVAAYCLVGAATAIVAIPRWLGPREQLAGVVAAILLIGQGSLVLTEVMAALAKSANYPGLESRYLMVGTAVNVALTVPLALAIGVIGVPIGTAAGSIISSLYFPFAARHRISPHLRNFFSDVPKLGVAVSVAATGALEVPAYLLAPRGAIGLLCCALPAFGGLTLYLLVIVGPVRVWGLIVPRRSVTEPYARHIPFLGLLRGVGTAPPPDGTRNDEMVASS